MAIDMTLENPPILIDNNVGTIRFYILTILSFGDVGFFNRMSSFLSLSRSSLLKPFFSSSSPPTFSVYAALYVFSDYFSSTRHVHLHDFVSSSSLVDAPDPICVRCEAALFKNES